MSIINPSSRTRGFWGKISVHGDTIDSWLPLSDHCRDVAATFRVIAGLPTIRERLSHAAGMRLLDYHIDRLGVIAFLHDIGKCNLGFQDKVFDPKAPRIGHIAAIAPLLVGDLAIRAAEALRTERMTDWFDRPATFQSFMMASWSHHGEPVVFDSAPRYRTWWTRKDQRDPMEGIAEVSDHARLFFPKAFEKRNSPFTRMPQLQHRFAGLLMLSDWLASHERYFPIERTADFDSRSAADNAIRSVGLDVNEAQLDLGNRAPSFVDHFGYEPFPLQESVFSMPVDDDDNRLLIVEAETGSGKTETAIGWFFKLFASGQVDSLYFALPTRVAARQLYERIHKYVERAFPDARLRPSVVLAVPGYARVDNVPVKSLLPDSSALWDDNERRRLRDRAWAAERPKRFLAATMAIGTIDQALLSALQVRHAHLRSVCLDRSLLVVDEVHASDTYMQRLLKGLLDHHVGLGGHSVLLSATLGSRLRTDVTNSEPQDLDDACRVAYPSVTSRSGVPAVPLEIYGSAKKVHVDLLCGSEETERVVDEIVNSLEDRARVLVVMNTVRRAVSLQRALEEDGRVPLGGWFSCADRVCPHHGRYAPPDRELLDHAVGASYGKDSPPGARVLVGTQTLEQSLDIDADLLVTDLCPMDVLLQRIGRLHRHERERPKRVRSARCIVITPSSIDLSSLLDLRGRPTSYAMKIGFGSVYEDIRVLQLTVSMLAAEPDIEIPLDNRRLVEYSTHSDALTKLTSERWKRHGEDVEGIGLANRVAAHYALLTDLYERDFGDISFHDPEERIRTRLGMDNLRVELDRNVTSPFGVNLTEIIIPGHMLPTDVEDEVAVIVSNNDDHILFDFGGRRYSYSRFGLETG